MKHFSTLLKTGLVALCSSLTFQSMAQTMMPLQTYASSFSGNTRGLWFTAPTSFTIVGLRVPTDVGTGAQSIHMARLSAPPAVYSATTSTFTTLHYSQNVAGTAIIPVNIPVASGDVIVVLGCRNNGSGASLTAYSVNTAYTSNIAGYPMALGRAGWQGSIITSAAANFWQEATNYAIGRVEIYYVTTSGWNNAGVSGLVSPSLFCAGTQPIKVRIADKGTNRLDSVRVNWQLDGVTQPTIFFNSPLDTLGNGTLPNDTVLTLSSATFAPGVAHTLRVWTSMPNGVADTVTTDDTLNVTLKPGLSGSYTIGGASPDYPNVVAAVADLTTYGMCGPVTFNIRNGTYTGQVSLGSVVGASATNTITFRSETGVRDSVTISFASTGTGEGVVKCNSASFVTFRGLRLYNTNTTASTVVSMAGTCNMDTFENCIIQSAATSTTGTYDIYSSAATISNLVIRNNLITGAYYGMYIYGASANLLNNVVIENNVIQGIYYYIGYLYYHSGMKFRNNTVNINTTGTTTSFFVYYHTNSIFANNVIYSAPNVTTLTVNLFYSSTNVGIYNNSFNTNNTAGNGITMYNYVTAGYDVKNNVFNNNSTGYAATYYYPLSTYAYTTDNNVYNTNGATLINQVSPAVTYANLAAWRAAFPTLDKNSYQYRPGYMSSSNAQPNPADTASWVLNGRGAHLAAVTSDFYGNSRPATRFAGVPDIGAYEFTPTSVPPPATPVPATAVAGGTQSFVFAADTVAKIVWDVTASIPSSITLRQYTGVRPPYADTSQNNYMYAYLAVNAPAGYSNYAMKMMYKDNWIGKNPTEAGLYLAQRSNAVPATGWAAIPSGTVDTTNNVMTGSVSFDYGLFTGTDVLNPIPVRMSSNLAAYRAGNDVFLNWATASEINSAGFDIEVSTDRSRFVKAGAVTAAGNSNRVLNYRFTHGRAFNTAGQTLYYRLKMTDRDGSFTYSNMATVSNSREVRTIELNVLPNPVEINSTLQLISAEATGATVTIIDISGKKVMEKTIELQKGLNELALEELSTANSGVYFVKVNAAGETFNTRVVKAGK